MSGRIPSNVLQDIYISRGRVWGALRRPRRRSHSNMTSNRKGPASPPPIVESHSTPPPKQSHWRARTRGLVCRRYSVCNGRGESRENIGAWLRVQRLQHLQSEHLSQPTYRFLLQLGGQ